MHVGIDLLFLVPNQAGGRETYIRELLPRMRAHDSQLRITAFVNRETAAIPSGFWREHADEVRALPTASARARGRWALAQTALLPSVAASAKVDVLHSPANFGVWHGPFARVLTLHDIGFRTHPELLSRATRWGTEVLIAPAVRRAHRVITVSEASRQDMVGRIGVEAERIDVIPNGVDRAFIGDARRARARLGAQGRTIALAVATELPHKNTPALVDAIATLAPEERPLLVLAGAGTDTGPAVARARALGVGNDVRGLGVVGAADLEDLYAAADVVTTATLYEGFGLPVLDALARGVTVACSDLRVLREVAGEAAIYFDPRQPAAIADALRAVLHSDAGAARRRAAGLRRAASFSWTVAARQTLTTYRLAAEAAAARQRAHAAAVSTP